MGWFEAGGIGVLTRNHPRAAYEQCDTGFRLGQDETGQAGSDSRERKARLFSGRCQDGHIFLSPVTPPGPPIAAVRVRASEAVPLQCQTACGASHVTIM
jgi:hypothetical protein